MYRSHHFKLRRGFHAYPESRKKGAIRFLAPADAVEVSDEGALLTQVSKTAAPGLFGKHGIQQGKDVALKNLTAQSGTFAGTINANGGINIPLAVGAPMDTAAVNRLYAAGLSFASEVFALSFYPVKSSCSTTGGASFDDTLAPVSLCLITFNPVRDANVDGYHVRVREIYWSNKETGIKVKTMHSLVKEGSNQRIPLCVAKIVYGQYRNGGIDTEERGALWLIHVGSTASPCIKIATVRGEHCFESNSLVQIYLDIDNSSTTNIRQIRIGMLTQHVGLSSANPAYY